MQSSNLSFSSALAHLLVLFTHILFIPLSSLTVITKLSLSTFLVLPSFIPFCNHLNFSLPPPACLVVSSFMIHTELHLFTRCSWLDGFVSSSCCTVCLFTFIRLYTLSFLCLSLSSRAVQYSPFLPLSLPPRVSLLFSPFNC